MNNGKLAICKLNGDTVSYDVEIPENDEEYYVGLSYKDFISEKTGMFYNYLSFYPAKEGMYTPDTTMSVDFIFFDNCGTIIKIHKNAKPLSSELISCFSVGAVLEVNAGDCDKYGIDLGDVAIFPFDSNHKMFQPLKVNNVKYVKTVNRVFAFTDSGKYYMYSYKSHCWLEVVDSYMERFNEINLTLKNFSEEEIINEKEANDFAINYDKQLLFDYRKHKKRYYQNDKYLIYEYTPETGLFRYYKFKFGWVGFDDVRLSRDKFLMLRETSLILTSDCVNELINEVEKNFSDEQISRVNKQNNDNYISLKCGFFEYSHCFYKENNSPGWFHSYMDGNKQICENRLEKLKNNKKIYDYKVYSAGGSIIKFNTELYPSLPSAFDTHLCSNWIIMQNENKIYLENEIVNEPVNKPEETKKLSMTFRQTKFYSFDPYDFEDENEIISDVSFSLRTDFQKSGSFIVIADDFVTDIPKFIQNLEKNNFAVLKNEEYTYFKLLAWKYGNDKVRLIMQNYEDSTVKTEADTIVEKEILFNSLKKLEKSFKKLHEKI